MYKKTLIIYRFCDIINKDWSRIMKCADFKKIIKLVAVFLMTISVLYLALVSAAIVPNHLINDNMHKSAKSLGKVKAFSFENGDNVNSIADNYADSILLNISYNMGRGSSFVSALDTDYYDGGEYGENYGLLMTVSEDIIPNTDYTRYWHGGAIFVRIALLFTDLDGMRSLGFYIICLLIIVNVVILVFKKRYFAAASLCVSLCAVQFWNIALSLEYQAPFAICFALMPFYILLEQKHPSAVLYLSCISGAMIAFFDFLTTETLTILLPLIAVIAIRAKDGRAGDIKDIFLFVLKCLIIWLASYAGAFVIKWLLASIVTGTNCFKTALFSVSERFGGDFAGYFDRPQNIFSAIYTNLSLPFGAEGRNDFMLAFIGTLIFLLVVFSVWYLFRKKQIEKTASPVILCLGMLVILRFLILNNHSFLHCFFTYRALCSTVFAILMFLWLNIGKNTDIPKKKRTF